MADTPQQRQVVGIGQAEVEQRDRDRSRGLLQARERLPGAASFDDGIARAFETFAHRPPDERLVVNDQDCLHA